MNSLAEAHLIACKLALGPVLLAQAKRLRRTAMRLPEAQGERQGSVSKSGRPLRILFVGDSSAAGVGVSHQSEALAAPTIRHLSELTQQSASWQLVARSGINVEDALALVCDTVLAPADVLVTALGVNDVTSQHSARRFVDNYQQLVHEVRERAGVRTVVVNGVPPMHVMAAMPQPLRWYLGRCARVLDDALQRWVDQQPGMRHVSLQWAASPHDMAQDRFHPGPRQYHAWATRLACLIHEGLPRELAPASLSPAASPG